MDAIAERASGQSWQLPGVTISKRNSDAICSEILQAQKRVGSKARLALLTIRYDVRVGCFQVAYRIA